MPNEAESVIKLKELNSTVPNRAESETMLKDLKGNKGKVSYNSIMNNSTVPNKAESSETLKDIKVEHSLKCSLNSDSNNKVEHIKSEKKNESELMSKLSSEFNEHQDSFRSSEYNGV